VLVIVLLGECFAASVDVDEDRVHDDQTTSNEVTSSTDCHPDGHLPRSLPAPANTPPNNNNPVLSLNPPPPTLVLMQASGRNHSVWFHRLSS